MSAVRAGVVLAACVVVAGCNGDSSRTLGSPCDGFASRTDLGGLGVAEGLATYGKRAVTSAGLSDLSAPTPIRYAEVEVVSCRSGAVLASGATDADGRFRVPFLNTGRVGVYARVLSSSSRYPVSVRRSAAEPYLYGLASSVYDDAGDGETVTVSGVETVEALGSGVFNIFEQGVRGAETVEALSTTPPTVPLVWYWYPGNPDGTNYAPTARTITVLGTEDDADEFDDAVLLHEYGHYVLDVYSHDDSPGGRHALGDSSLDLRLAWSEGWADFFSSVVRGDPQHVDTGGGEVRLAFDIETPPTFLGGTKYDTNELAIAAALWDAYDSTTDADETAGPLNGLLADIWSVVRGLAVSPVTFEDFWAGWQTAPPGNLQPILDVRQIDLWDDQWESDTIDDAASGATPITLFPDDPLAIQHHTLYPSGDVDYVMFTAPADGTYTVATSRCVLGACDARVSNAADTILDVIGVTPPPSTADNVNGQTYSASCALDCPPNDASTLSSKVTFTATSGASYVVQVRRSPSAPPSAGETGSYDIVVTRD